MRARSALLVLLLLVTAALLAAADTAADAEALYRTAIGLFNEGRGDEAAPALEQALALFEKARKPSRQVDAISLLGLVEYYRADYPMAERRFQQALDLARGEGLASQVPGIFNNLGLVRYAQGRYEEAIQLYRSAWEEHVKAGDEQAAAQSLGNIASVYLSLSRFPESELAYRQAMDSFQKAGDAPGVANTGLNLGLLYSAWGKYAEARAALEQGLTEARRLGLRQSEAYGLAGLGGVHFAAGQYDLAEQAYLAALRIDTELDLRLNVVSVTSSLGMVYQAWGLTDRALQAYRRALADAEKLGIPDQAVYATYFIGSALQADGRLDEALTQFRSALEQAKRLGREPAELPVLEAMGTASFLKRDMPSAEKWFREAYDLALRLDQPTFAARQLIHLGGVNEVMQNLESALRMYAMALDRCRAAGSKADEATVLNNLGTLALQRGAYAEAESRLLEAIAVKEQLRLTASGQTRMEFLATQLSSYRWLVTARVLGGDAAGAFDASELMKARWLADELGARQGDSAPFKGIRNAQGRIGEKALVVSFAGIDGEQPAVIAASRTGICARELAQIGPPASSASPDPESPEGENASSPSRGFRITTAPPEPTTLGGTIRRYRALLVLPTPSDAERAERERIGHELYRQLLAPIQESLDGKDELLLIPDGVLYALPFESLVLPDGRYLVERFHVTYVPSLAVYELLAARHPSNAGAQPPGGPGRVLALGGAQYGAPQHGGRPQQNPGVSVQQLSSLRLAAEELVSKNRGLQEIYQYLGLGSWDDLPGTRAEVAAISALLPETTVLTGADASEAALKRMSRDGSLARFPVMHFATHGFAVPEAPDLSALVLAPGNGGTAGAGGAPGDGAAAEDGYLTTREIAGLKLNAQFVNLSACETGMGRILGGEGVVGLSQAFLTAGASSLSVSLWPVSDEGTQTFMTELYEAVARRGLSFARAMTEVKRAFIREGSFREPFYWAPFVFYGR
jgi:CHAT domain-containing protein/tetratricopeptide (TPR) repeat protein